MQQLPALPGFRAWKRGVWRAAGPKGAVTAGWQSPGGWVGGVPVRLGPSPAALKNHPSLPRCWPGNLSATSPTTPDCGQGEREGLGFQNSLQKGTVPREGLLSHHRRGLPNPYPRPCGRDRILQRRSQEQTLPPASPPPPDTSQSESHACPCI